MISSRRNSAFIDQARNSSSPWLQRVTNRPSNKGGLLSFSTSSKSSGVGPPRAKRKNSGTDGSCDDAVGRYEMDQREREREGERERERESGGDEVGERGSHLITFPHVKGEVEGWRRVQER